MTDLNLIREKFAHDKPRPGQLETIKAILDAFESGKRFVFLEAPTGSGKSVLALTTARFFEKSYYLTIQKFLQTQISNEFGGELTELKGRSNYPCTFYENFGQSLVNAGQLRLDVLTRHLSNPKGCDAGYCQRQLLKYKCTSCFPKEPTLLRGNRHSLCPYYEQVGLAIESPKVLMNFSSFLYQTTFASDRFGRRDLMIIDEGHHCEGQVMDFVTITINDRIFQDLGIEIPELTVAADYAIWIDDNKIIERLHAAIGEAEKASNLRLLEELGLLVRRLDKFMAAISDGNTEWISEYECKRMPGVPPVRTVTIKPIFVQHFTNDLLFEYGSKVLIMSATILDAGIMAHSLGIDKSELMVIKMPNSFPKKNRPIRIIPAYKATGGKSAQHNWGPTLVDWVDRVVSGLHPNHRGIIHTHNFSIAHQIMKECDSRDRFLFQENFQSKEDMLLEHKHRHNSVIVAPAMHEGLDLKDDLSRFQILCKTPYPNFFDDKQLGRRIELDRAYLRWLVALKIVQSVGRSVRSPTDWAITYILDSTIIAFLRESKKIIPGWFHESITILSDQQMKSLERSVLL